MTRKSAAFIPIVLLPAATTHLFSQLLGQLRRPALQETAVFGWSLNSQLVPTLSRSIVIGPRVSFPVGNGPDPEMAERAGRGRPLVPSEVAATPAQAGTRGMLVQEQCKWPAWSEPVVRRDLERP